MMRLAASLVAAAAGLALIPLALASSASAAATTTSPGTPGQNWAGYADIIPHPTQVPRDAGNQMASASVTFTIPKINCSASIIGPHESSASYRKTHGNVWSAVAFWAGLDGAQHGTVTDPDGGTPIEQAGIDGVCHSEYGSAVYQAFYQMDTYANGPSTYPALKTVSGKAVAPRAGDVISVRVSDYMPHRPDHKTGESYYLSVDDVTRGARWSAGEDTAARAPDAQAEVITEAVSNGPYVSRHAIGLAAFSPVHYTNAIVSSFPLGYVYGYPLGEPTELYTPQKDYVDHHGALISTGPIKTVDYDTYSTFTSTFR
jgi:hypothetical protein